MKLASLRDGTPEGRLVVVSRDEAPVGEHRQHVAAGLGFAGSRFGRPGTAVTKCPDS